MPTSHQKPEIVTNSPSTKAENDAPATASTETSPRHEESTETMQTVVLKDSGNEADPPHDPEHTISRPTKTVDCNMLSYTDGEGIARHIYMPKGTMHLACALYDGKRFDDLAKFPAWGE